MLPKIMISAPVNSRKEYIRQRYLDNISGFEYYPKRFYFVDNSFNLNYHSYAFIQKGFECDYVSPVGKNNNAYICESQNKIRDQFLSSDCEYLFMLEEDLLPHKEIAGELLDCKKEVVACSYFTGVGRDSHLLHQIFDHSFGENVNINYSPAGSFAEWGTDKHTNENYGLGCMLIHREVMEQIPFRVQDEINHSDVCFALDLNYLGIEITHHMKIIPHENSNWLSFLDFKHA